MMITEYPDELDITFIPEAEEELINRLKAVDDDSDMEEATTFFHEWAEKVKTTNLHSQSRCNERWPFNDHFILGTFHHIQT